MSVSDSIKKLVKVKQRPLDYISSRVRPNIRLPQGILYNEDCLNILKLMPDNCIDTVITDPPAGISFMAKGWDSDKGGRDKWINWLSEILKECYRVAKPGAVLLCWSIPRTSHWTGFAIEDAGWFPKDCIYHIFASGFPKSHNISKAIDEKLGAEREVVRVNQSSDYNAVGKSMVEQGCRGVEYFGDRENKFRSDIPITEEAKLFDGYGSNLKPAAECWWLAMKLNEGSFADNALKWGVAGLNIDSARIQYISEEDKLAGGRDKPTTSTKSMCGGSAYFKSKTKAEHAPANNLGRWPANVVLECICDEVIEEGTAGIPYEYKDKEYKVEGFIKDIKPQAPSNYNDKGKRIVHTNPACPCYMLDQQSGISSSSSRSVLTSKPGQVYGAGSGLPAHTGEYGFDDMGGASRFFYIAKASTSEKNAGLEDMEEKPPAFGKNMSSSDKGTISGSKLPHVNNHPTCKPLKLMEYLCNLTKTPKGGIVLDPFLGSGTVALAAKNTGRLFVGIEKEKEYFDIAVARIR